MLAMRVMKVMTMMIIMTNFYGDRRSQLMGPMLDVGERPQRAPIPYSAPTLF